MSGGVFQASRADLWVDDTLLIVASIEENIIEKSHVVRQSNDTQTDLSSFVCIFCVNSDVPSARHHSPTCTSIIEYYFWNGESGEQPIFSNTWDFFCLTFALVCGRTIASM